MTPSAPFSRLIDVNDLDRARRGIRFARTGFFVTTGSIFSPSSWVLFSLLILLIPGVEMSTACFTDSCLKRGVKELERNRCGLRLDRVLLLGT